MRIRLGVAARCIALAAGLLIAACSSNSASTAAIEGEVVGDQSALPSATESSTTAVEVLKPVLETPCLELNASLVLPPTYIAADVCPTRDTCLFILQAEGLADTSVIAAELFVSSGGRSFDEFAAMIPEGLSRGQEPDLLSLQLLNTGASGRDLPVLDRVDITSPNKAVVFKHESDRRDGFIAYSAVVDAPHGADGTTRALFLWAVSNPKTIGGPHPNDELLFDVIDAIEFDLEPSGS